MSAPRRHGLLASVLAVVALVSVLPAAAPGQGADTEEGQVAPAASPTEEQEHMRRELVELADVWALGGGTFGYPFWEKAGQRWTAGQLSTPIYREYSTGYRDRLRAGCELIDALDFDEDVSGDVRDLVDGACSRRVEALRAQQRWLDVLIELDAPAATATVEDREARTERVAELQQEAVEHERSYREALQESYRDVRLAMDLAQAELVAAGLERLPEDAFV